MVDPLLEPFVGLVESFVRAMVEIERIRGSRLREGCARDEIWLYVEE